VIKQATDVCRESGYRLKAVIVFLAKALAMEEKS